ncbi:hypothetical protein [Neptunicoccus sediminis]|uniref:hypothetical protein n=1 Tax=Neptunicoccus sediminis TaxID=1892596 RepID=UPI000845CA04|nr:hypothetical protein [Neptunicoccus sediminis]
MGKNLFSPITPAADRDARPLFARAPAILTLLPYREGKAASTFTAIGSPACTAESFCDRNGFNVLKILKENFAGLGRRTPPAGVFGGTLKREGVCDA